MKKSVIITVFLLTLALFIAPNASFGQIVQPARVSTTANCISAATQTAGQTTYATVNAQGQICVISGATANTSGVTISDSVTTSTAQSAAAVTITTSAGQLYGVTVDAGTNTSGVTVWVNVFGTSSGNVTAGTTTPLFSIPVAVLATSATGPQSSTPMPWGAPIGIPYPTGLSANCTTTRNGTTGCQAPAHLILVRKQ